jgi:hypothetical protein
MFTTGFFLVLSITIVKQLKNLCNKNANNNSNNSNNNNSKQIVHSDDPDVDNKLLQKV